MLLRRPWRTDQKNRVLDKVWTPQFSTTPPKPFLLSFSTHLGDQTLARSIWKRSQLPDAFFRLAQGLCASSRSTRSEPVCECSKFMYKKKTVKTRSLALERSIEQQGRVIDEWRRRSGSFAFAGQPAVDHPAANCWHASSKKNRPSWCLFSFEWQRFCLWEQLG